MRNWDLVREATESRFDAAFDRDVYTLYVDDRSAVRKAAKDRRLMRRERDEPDLKSSHWNP